MTTAAEIIADQAAGRDIQRHACTEQTARSVAIANSRNQPGTRWTVIELAGLRHWQRFTAAPHPAASEIMGRVAATYMSGRKEPRQ